MNYQESLAYLYARLPMFQRVGAPALKYDLGNTKKLLQVLGNPHLEVQCVHIAGTNGKGSSAHAIASVLTASGYKTGLFTSPHLKSFTERAKVDGREMSEVFVAQFVTDLAAVVEEINPSFFEVTFAMAMTYFKKECVDIAIIETGLGGRLDSTNIISPIVCLITMIGWDHADLLGDTLEKIALEKAGIIKKSVPVVIGADQSELLHVFSETAIRLDSPLFTSSAFRIEQTALSVSSAQVNIYNNDVLVFENLDLDITAAYFQKNLSGVFQLIEILRSQGWSISDLDIRKGLASAKESSGLMGRWQVLGSSPLVVADISHNLPGLQALFAQVDLLSPNTLHLIFGVVKDKSLDSILAFLSGYNALFYFTQSTVPRSLSSLDLQKKGEEFGLIGDAYNDVNAAIAAAKLKAKEEDLILICGSTFVVAEIAEL